MKARYLYSELSGAIEARRNCINCKNGEWLNKWTDRITILEHEFLPSGSGLDCGTHVDLKASHAEKIVLNTAFHHMNEAGSYDGWTEHTIVVTPAFDGINLRISGRDRNDIKDYLHDTFSYALSRMVEYTEDGYNLAS